MIDPTKMPELPDHYSWSVFETHDSLHNERRIKVALCMADFQEGYVDVVSSEMIDPTRAISAFHLGSLVIKAAHQVWGAWNRDLTLTQWMKAKPWER